MSQDQEHIEQHLKLCRIGGETGGETESKKYREDILALWKYIGKLNLLLIVLKCFEMECK